MSISLISRSVSDFGNTFTKKMELEKKNINKRRSMWLSEGGGKLEIGKSESQ